jgi:acetoin utilization deacetylase AcuC-like enzyme
VNHLANRPAGAATAGLYFSHASSLEHDPRARSPGHPDTPERLRAIAAALEGWDWSGWQRREAPAASEAELELIHSPRHVRAIAELSRAGGGAIDPDTAVGPASYRAAAHAAGAACAMTRSLLAGEAAQGFCAVRPSGHHAEADRAMGFCLFNNIAIAAEYAIRELGLERVFVLDWDVHHGNGTAEAFRYRADVLFASIHQSPLYPGTGPLEDAGAGTGEGYTINLPVPPGAGEELWLSLLEHVVLRAAAAFAPQLVLLSAGFDAHAADPLADCRLRTSSFAEMALLVRGLAREVHAPLGAVLEGGYEPRALGESVRATLEALGGDGEARSGAPVLAEAARAAAQVSRHWPL